MTYKRQVIGRGRAEFGGEIGIECVNIFKIDEEALRVMKETFSVRQNVLLGLEASDKFLKLLKDRVVGGGGR